MIENEKLNPFRLLRLSVTATSEEVVERGRREVELADGEDHQRYCRWAMEQLITHPFTRLQYELFEAPGADYDDAEWQRFVRTNRRNPVDLGASAGEASALGVADCNVAALLEALVCGLLAVPAPDVAPALETPPVDPDFGVPPLDVSDVLFG